MNDRFRAGSLLWVGLAACFTVFPAWPGEETAPLPEGLEYPEARRFCVYGKVVDEAGEPVEGAEVRSACGRGSLMPTGRTATDRDGAYYLFFGPGIRKRVKSDETPYVTGAQMATVYATKPGLVERNLCRQGNLAMADPASVEEAEGWKTAGVVVFERPYRLDFTLVPVASLRLRLAGEPEVWNDATILLQGEREYPSTSVYAFIKPGAERQLELKGLLPQEYWLDVQLPGRATTATERFAIPEAGAWEAELRIGPQPEGAAEISRPTPVERP